MHAEMNAKSVKNISEQTLIKFCDFLCQNMGLYFPEGKRKEAIPKIEKIVNLFGFNDPDHCLDFLTKTPLAKKQIMTLAKELSVGETYFFRNPASFRALEAHVFPSLIQNKLKNKDQSIRIWSAGCCTGEEIYSVAMILHQLIPNLKQWNLWLLGTDINNDFLEKARSGTYKEWSFRGTPDYIKKRYFTFNPLKRNYTLNTEIRSLVSFDYLNLISGDYPSQQTQTHEMDLILCNHVLIYFSKAHINQVIQQFAKALNDSGWLGISDIEVPFIECPLLVSQKIDEALFFRKNKGQIKNSEIPRLFPRTLPPPTKPKKEEPLKNEKSFSRPTEEKKLYPTFVDWYHAKKYSEVISSLETQLSLIKEKDLYGVINEVILLTKAYANEGNLLKAQVWCEKGLSVDKVNPLLHYLHAVILQELDQSLEALSALKKAVFLDPELIIAHFSLAILYQQQKQEKEAQRHLKNVSYLLNKRDPEEIVPGTDDITIERLKKIAENIQTLSK